MSNLKSKVTRFPTVFIVTIIIASLIVGGLLGYSISNLAIQGRVSNLENQLSTLQKQVLNLQSRERFVYVQDGNVSLSLLYEQVKDSVVVIQGIVLQYDVFRRPYYVQVQGSGFIYSYTNRMVVITNYHVVSHAANITVTFVNGDGYVATVLGSDPYADLAVLSTDAPRSEYKPLEIAGSLSLRVGDPVMALGNPYGLAGSMTSGIVSALGRTITEEISGGYVIADCVQTTTAINPGNSGGPLLNYQGHVIGVTTAVVSGSQGLGFAIPSSTILREIDSLIAKGSYYQHSWLAASGIDMTYEIAKAMRVNVTYGWLVTNVAGGGPAEKAGLRAGAKQILVNEEKVTIGGDIIVGIDGQRIIGIDDLSAYLEEHTSPGQTISVTVVRDGRMTTLTLQLGTRPPPSTP